MKSSLRIGLSAAIAFLLSSCRTTEVSTETSLDDVPVPQSWSESSGTYASQDWVATFGSSKLSQLVIEAQENNFGLESAYQNVRAAEAAARISGANRLPSVGAGLRSSDSQSLFSFDPPITVDSESHALSLSTRWEVDIWNRLAEEHLAAKSQYRASENDYQSFQLSLSSQVARAWFNVIESKSQFELADASAKAFDSKLEVLESRYSRGLTDAFDLRLTRAQASSTRASAIARRSQMDTSVRQLETLLGRYPSAELQTSETLPSLPETPNAGLPSELIERRPDVLAQQNRLLAALALEKSASKNWLPSLVLTGSDGTLSNDFSDLLDSDFNVWSIAGDLTIALFQGGRLKGQRDQLKASQLSQLARYKDTVISAFREVETSLRAEKDLLDLEQQTEIASNENQLAEEQAWKLYARGLVDITAALDAERRSFEAQSQLLSIRNQRLQNRISLHIALGGDL
ncbi:efflux transporter outer membrane subunit [Pelagicoccus mobilis]|uniref:Efflux transporter outer membrane subunit n=1 Tax=Pelagicoccus mobilis TaxID=415221 RepID=A0A934RXF3_9BACT|nr:efflux transporter outer membrane subunit [Pelagicoccus mobilis]MBK1878098.1 efflux transporter outer membrane subunit [Pelagicoccus mobilis]